MLKDRKTCSVIPYKDNGDNCSFELLNVSLVHSNCIHVLMASSGFD